MQLKCNCELWHDRRLTRRKPPAALRDGRLVYSTIAPAVCCVGWLLTIAESTRYAASPSL